MEQTVRVVQTYEDATARVIHIRQSACSGDCHKCSGCGAAQQTLLLTADNPIGAKVGDVVVIQSRSGPVLAAAAVLYLLPLALFLAGYILGALLWTQGLWMGLAGFVLAVALAIVYDRLVLKKKKSVYTITGYGHSA